MSSHFGSVEFNFPTGSTMTGSQALPAAGYAEGLKLEKRKEPIDILIVDRALRTPRSVS